MQCFSCLTSILANMPLAEKPAVNCRNENIGLEVSGLLQKWMQYEVCENVKIRQQHSTIGRSHGGEEKRAGCQ